MKLELKKNKNQKVLGTPNLNEKSVLLPNEQDKIDAESRLSRLDELNEKQLETYAQNCWLVNLITKGVSIANALERLEITRSERSVRDLVQRFRAHGYAGLLDKRWLRKTDSTVLTLEIKKIALGVYFTYPAAGPTAVWRKLKQECNERELSIPSCSSIKKFLQSLPEPFKLFRQGKIGIRKWEQTAAPVVRYENTSFANERWQADHTPLPIWIRVKVDGVWVPREVHLSAALDAHTRAISGFVVSAKYPDSWTISLLLRKSILKKSNKKWRNCGIPFTWESDRGKDFLSQNSVSTIAKLKVILDLDPPYYPNCKGKVEIFFQTLDSGCLTILPGHKRAIGTSETAAAKRVHELLTLPQLAAEIERFIVDDYHQTIHSETGRKPAEHWEETVKLRMPETENDLNLLLLKEDVTRSVKNIGISLTYQGIKYTYWSPELPYHFKRRVRLAYNPEDMESVLVYCAETNERICEAFDMRADEPHYTVEDVRNVRNQFKRGVLERVAGYMEEIEHEDRRAARKTQWKEARESLLEQQDELNAEYITETLAENDEVWNILAALRERDRE